MLFRAFSVNPFVPEYLLCRSRMPDIGTQRSIVFLPDKDVARASLDIAHSSEPAGKRTGCDKGEAAGGQTGQEGFAEPSLAIASRESYNGTMTQGRIEAAIYVSEFGCLWGSASLHRQIYLTASKLACMDGVLAGVPFAYHIRALRLLDRENGHSLPFAALDFLAESYRCYLHFEVRRNLVMGVALSTVQRAEAEAAIQRQASRQAQRETPVAGVVGPPGEGADGLWADGHPTPSGEGKLPTPLSPVFSLRKAGRLPGPEDNYCRALIYNLRDAEAFKSSLYLAVCDSIAFGSSSSASVSLYHMPTFPRAISYLLQTCPSFPPTVLLKAHFIYYDVFRQRGGDPGALWAELPHVDLVMLLLEPLLIHFLGGVSSGLPLAKVLDQARTKPLPAEIATALAPTIDQLWEGRQALLQADSQMTYCAKHYATVQATDPGKPSANMWKNGAGED